MSVVLLHCPNCQGEFSAGTLENDAPLHLRCLYCHKWVNAVADRVRVLITFGARAAPAATPDADKITAAPEMARVSAELGSLPPVAAPAGLPRATIPAWQPLESSGRFRILVWVKARNENSLPWAVLCTLEMLYETAERAAKDAARFQLEANPATRRYSVVEEPL
jgi:hypothetical protein